MRSELNLVFCLGLLAFSILGSEPQGEVRQSVDPSQIQNLAESIHETLERENPDLKGVRSVLHRFFYNWNYFRTYVQRIRLAHAANSSNAEATKHVLNTSLLLLGTHLFEHVVGHGLHYASTFSSDPWIYWSGTLVGEAIASPFVEVACGAGICIYARSPSFQDAVTHIRVGGYNRLVKKWAQPLLSLFFESATGLERLKQSFGEDVLQRGLLHLPESDPLIVVKVSALPQGDVVLDSFEAKPHEFSAEEWKKLRQSLKPLGWNIADGVWSSLTHLKNNHLQMLRSEVFVDSVHHDPLGKVVVTMKPGALRRTSRPRLKRCAKTIMENSPQ